MFKRGLQKDGTRLVIAFVIFLILAGAAVASTPPQDEQETVRAQFADLLRYLEVSEKASAADLDRLTELKIKSEKADLTAEERVATLTDFYAIVWRLMELEGSLRASGRTPEGAAKAFEPWMTQYGGKFRIALHRTEPGVPGGRLHVRTQGRGPIPMLLIAGIGLDADALYHSFMERNADRYTMYAVTLPGFGQAEPARWPEVRDHTRRPWLNGIAAALTGLIREKNLNNCVVVGTAVGGYFAARLALEQPERIRSAVLIGALVKMPLQSFQEPDRPMGMEERLALANKVLPAQLMPSPPLPPRDRLLEILSDPKLSYPGVTDYWASSIADSALSAAWSADLLSSGGQDRAFRYYYELWTTDLTQELEHLSVPLLAVAPSPSPLAPGPQVAQWEEIKLRYPSIPLTLVPFEGARFFLTIESPVALDRAITDFLASRKVEGTTDAPVTARSSPRAGIRQSIGATEVSVRYGRSAVQEREIWGKLVRYGRVWRTGANEATTISLSSDVMIEGQPLAAGTYSLFTIPTEREWTVIFNRIVQQWGAFSYNPEFDALRLTVNPEPGEHQEWLSFHFEVLDKGSARLVLRWEKLRLPIQIEGSS